MQGAGSWLSSFFVGEYEGKALQRTGMVTKEQLEQFFHHGKVLFENPDFKMALALGHQQGQNIQELVDQAQAKVWEEKVQPPVQGDWGIASLSRVLGQYKNDAAFLQMFYEFVHLEEKTLDEAEMPAQEFETKYAKIAAIKGAMERQLQEHEAKMQGMNEEEKQKYLAEMYKTMVDASLGMSGPPSCSRGGSYSAGAHGPKPPAPSPMQAPVVAQAPPSVAGGDAGCTQPGCTDTTHVHESAASAAAAVVPGPAAPGAAVMSEKEQMAFFQSMQGPRQH